jgi:hypothetical protein
MFCNNPNICFLNICQRPNFTATQNYRQNHSFEYLNQCDFRQLRICTYVYIYTYSHIRIYTVHHYFLADTHPATQIMKTIDMDTETEMQVLWSLVHVFPASRAVCGVPAYSISAGPESFGHESYRTCWHNGNS